jgi:hypothetical protein
MAITLSATLPSGTDLENLGANASGGSTVGASASELVSFHGSAAVDQSTLAGTSISNAPVSLSGFALFSSCAAVSNLIASHNAILACLVEKGLMA